MDTGRGSSFQSPAMAIDQLFDYMGIDDGYDPDSEIDYAPLTIVSTESKQKKYRVQGRSGPAYERASKVHAKFRKPYPSFTKHMRASHVVWGFWLHIPHDFCRRHLPNYDVRMTLQDEDGQRGYAVYLSERGGLSAGWRKFAIEHSLMVGDTVIFKLVRPTEFKVYITREGDVRPKEKIRALESEIANLKDALKAMDVEMEDMVIRAHLQ